MIFGRDPQRVPCRLCPICKSAEIYEHNGEFAACCEECKEEQG